MVLTGGSNFPAAYGVVVGVGTVVTTNNNKKKE